ncbi:MAG: lamin tail domain-containing protein [Pseudomonadota bacterium]
MRQLASVLVITMFLSACGWESGFEELGTPEPSAPATVSWNGAPAQECASDQECARTSAPGPCEMAICDAGTCAIAPAPVGTACDPDGLGECEVGICAAAGEGVACATAVAPNGMPCMLDDWAPPTTIRTCHDGACGAATECLVDADCADQDDGDLCNGVVTCQGRYCLLNPSSVVDCAGFPVGACEVPVCNPETGACLAEAGEDGLPCDDGDPCTGGDLCAVGECLGETVLCETVCDDDIDDDDDGMTDCEDDECGDDPACADPACDDGECNGDETCVTCPADCGECPAACDDGECNGDETCDTCPADCGVCPACDDGECNGDETCDTCPADCGACPVCDNNDACEGEEDCASCPADCGVCMTACDGVCGQAYTPGSPCQCSASCFVYENCCTDICEFCSDTFSLECNPPVCGDELCNAAETCNSCEGDCGTCDNPAPLWISEYVEGGSNNKAVELFNGGNAAIDLSGCRFNRYSNGDDAADAVIVAVAPEEETLLAAGATWVVCHGSFQAPQLTDGTCQFTTSGLNHNGNDALELICGGVPTDVFGTIGFDPGGNGWTGGDPLVATKDMTLRRKCTVAAGDTDGTDVFDPSVEWDGFPINTFDDLGAYVCD